MEQTKAGLVVIWGNLGGFGRRGGRVVVGGWWMGDLAHLGWLGDTVTGLE
jgi:hypothetical protein